MSDHRTRIVELRRGVDREEADNRKTGVVVADELPAPPFARLFPVAWPELRRLLLQFTQPGVVVVAVDAVHRRIAGSLCLAAKVGAANAAIVGRHGQCDLYLEGDPGLSLRHLALVVSPLAAGGAGPQVSFRVLDLRTRTAFVDEQGRRLESVTAEGPTFLAAGGHALFVVVSGDDTIWPERADEAWRCIPERVYLGEIDAEPDRWRRRRRAGRDPEVVEPTDGGALAEGTGVVETPVPARDAGRITLVRTQPGPARARVSLLGDGDVARGELVISSSGAAQRITVGERAAAAGILLGRYERCDTHGATVMARHGISRVHLLVVEVAGALYAIDTASTNGTHRAGPVGDAGELRIARLEAGAAVVLGDELATVAWRPATPA